MGAGIVTGILKGVTSIFGFLSGDPPQQFDKLKTSAFLQWVVQQAATTNAPVVFCWFDSMVKVNPDGSWFSFALIDSCADSPKWEAEQQNKSDIYVVRCRDGVDFDDLSSVMGHCTFIFKEGPGLFDSITGRVKDLIGGFDDTTIIPQPTQITPGGETDPTTGRPADLEVAAAGIVLPTSAKFALIAVGAIVLLGITGKNKLG